MNQTLEGYTLRFWKNIFRPKYIDVVQSVQSYRVYSLRTADAFLVVASEISLRKIASANSSGETVSVTFCFDVGQSDKRIEYSSSDSSRPRALKCVGF